MEQAGQIESSAPQAGEASSASGERRKVSPCNFRQTERLASAQVRAVSALNEGFARNLARAMAAYLRTSLECTLVSVEQVPYRDLLSRVPELSYVATLVASSDRTSVLIEIDLGIVFPVIDLLLGGEGKPEAHVRELTEIEEHVLEGVVRILCHELSPAWQPLGVKFEFQQREQSGNLPKLMAPEERTLVLGFEVSMPEVKGKMTLVFPGLLSNALLRRLAREGEYQRPKAKSGNERMRELVMDCLFDFELSFRDLMLPAGDVVKLSPGQVLPLRCAVQQPATASVGGVAMFSGLAARSGLQRAAQIVAKRDIAQKQESC